MWVLRLLVPTSVFLALACISVLPAGLADDRSAVPGTEEIAKAEVLVKDLFKAEYAKTKTADRLALANKLLQQASETKDDPTARYVLLREARAVAAKAGDASTAMKAAEELANAFQVGAGEARAAVANQIVAAIATPAGAAAATDILMAAGDEARSADDWASASVLAKAAEAVSRKGASATLATAAKNKLKEIETFRVEAEKVKDHIATLKTTPDDPAANLAVGRFYCLIKQDWDAGIGMLIKGSDAKLQDAAEKDIKARGGDDSEKLAAAEVWYELAGSFEPAAKIAFQLRSLHWYSDALPGLMGLTKAKTEKRITELQAIADAHTDKTKRWTTIRRAIAEGKIKKWGIIGAAFYQKEYEEIPKDGAILIGFHYTTISNGSYPGVMQPIFLTAKGEVKGNVYGAPSPNSSPPQVTKAKPGYAVGAIYTRGGGGIDAIKPIYMRMTEKGLDPNDKYDGPMIGGNGGGEGTTGGDGNFIIGIHGRPGNRNGDMAAISAVTLTSATKKKK